MLMSEYSVPQDRIFYIVYDENEFELTIETLQCERGANVRTMFDSFLGYGVFSELVLNVSISRGVRRIPHVLGLGLNVKDYTYRERDTLETLGYAQKWERSDVPQGFDIKRGPLALAVADRTGLRFKNTGLCIEGHAGGAEMNQWYQDVDCLLVPSLLEGGPLSPFEAAACGIPTIGTPVGHLMAYGATGGCLLVDPRPKKFVDDATWLVTKMREIPEFYQEVSLKAREEVEFYDWHYQHRDWVEFFALV